MGNLVLNVHQPGHSCSGFHSLVAGTVGVFLANPLLTGFLTASRKKSIPENKEIWPADLTFAVLSQNLRVW
jgi:hypothetical protein